MAAGLRRTPGGGRGSGVYRGPAGRPRTAAAACLQTSSLASSLGSNNNKKRSEEQLVAGRTVSKVAGVRSDCIWTIL